MLHQWLLKRNCALTPRQLGTAYGVLCCLSLTVAVAFTLGGAWFVIFFSCLELSAVGWAFLYHARHAMDQERILLDSRDLLILEYDGGKEKRIRLDPARTQVALPRQPGDLIHLKSDRLQIKVGRFATAAQRRQVALELQRLLPSGWQPF